MQVKKEAVNSGDTIEPKKRGRPKGSTSTAKSSNKKSSTKKSATPKTTKNKTEDSSNLPEIVNTANEANTPSEISGLVKLDNETKRLADSIIGEDNLDRTKALVSMFNLMQRKKNVLRVMKLNKLLDTATETMLERFEKQPDAFSTKDLNDSIKTIQGVLDSANDSLSLVDETPAIQINQQNNLNVTVGDSLGRDGSERVVDAVRAFLAKVQAEQSSNGSVIEVADVPTVDIDNSNNDNGEK